MRSVPAGHPNMGGPMRMNPPRGMAMGPQVRAGPERLWERGALLSFPGVNVHLRNISHQPFTSRFTELRRNEASPQLHGRSDARNEHVSETFRTSVEIQPPRYVNFRIFAFLLRGPGGRGPWPGPNTNSVSGILLSMFNGFYQLFLFIIETLLFGMCFKDARVSCFLILLFTLQIAYSSSSPGNYVVS